MNYDLTNVSDRLALVNLVFTYPSEPHKRKHGPDGYDTYESYRDWLRDEFSYRCVFSLVRETWIGRIASFDIDHLEPRTSRHDLINTYDNLLYLTHRLNLVRGKKRIIDPCAVAVGKCLRIHTEGEQIGQIEILNSDGKRIVDAFKLNNEDAVKERINWLVILRSIAKTNELHFRKLIGFPIDDLPDLSQKARRVKSNSRKHGIVQSARYLKDNGKLSEWFS